MNLSLFKKIEIHIKYTFENLLMESGKWRDLFHDGVARKY